MERNLRVIRDHLAASENFALFIPLTLFYHSDLFMVLHQYCTDEEVI